MTENMKEGELYNILQDYFDKYDKHGHMMDKGVNRPHMYAFTDKKNRIAYFIPCGNQHKNYANRDANLVPNEVDAKGTKQTLIIPKLIPVPLMYVKRPYRNGISIDDAQIVKNAVATAIDVKEKLSRGVDIRDGLKGFKDTVKSVTTEQKQIRAYSKYMEEKSMSPDKILLQQTNRRNMVNQKNDTFNVYGENAYDVSIALGRSTVASPTGVKLSDITDSIEINAKEIHEVVKQLNEKGHNVVLVTRDGKAQDYPHTPPEKEVSALTDETKSKLMMLEAFDLNKQLDLPNGNSIIAWLDKDKVFEIDVPTHLLTDQDKKYEDEILPGETHGAVEVEQKNSYRLVDLERLNIDISQINEMTIDESLYFAVKPSAKPYIEWTGNKETAIDNTDHTDQSDNLNTSDICENTSSNYVDYTDTKGKFSVIETDTGQLLLVLHEKECDYVLDYTDDPENLMGAIENVLNGLDIIQRRATPEEIENALPFEMQGNDIKIADENELDLLALKESSIAIIALDLEELANISVDDITNQFGELGIATWENYFEDRKEYEQKMATEKEEQSEEVQEVEAQEMLYKGKQNQESEIDLKDTINNDFGLSRESLKDIGEIPSIADTEIKNTESLYQNPDVLKVITELEANGKDSTIIKDLISHFEQLEEKVTAQTALLEQITKKIMLMPEMQEPSEGRTALFDMAEKLTNTIKETKNFCQNLKDSIITGCQEALQAIKEQGTKALDSVISYFNVKESYQLQAKTDQEQIMKCDKAINTLEKFASDTHKVGASLKNVGISFRNVGRTLIGREPIEQAEAKEAAKLAHVLTAPINAIKKIAQNDLEYCNKMIKKCQILEGRASQIKENESVKKSKKPDLNDRKEKAQMKVELQKKTKANEPEKIKPKSQDSR